MSRLAHDVLVIGAGVIGLSIARELLRRDVSVLVIDSEHAVGRGASGRNSGVLHPGFSVAPGSLKARFNVEGSRLMRGLCEELDVPLVEVGTVVVAAAEEETADLEAKLAAGRRNGLTDLRIVDRNELRELEPTVAGHAALYSPEGAVIDPRLLLVRLAESARASGCEFALGSEALAIGRERHADGTGIWRVTTSGGEMSARMLVNAAGVSAPAISRLAGGEEYDSFPCRGEYLILDRSAAGVPRRMVYPCTPRSGGLGVHFTPTVAGNTLIGPSASYIEDPDDHRTTQDVLRQLFSEASALCPTFDPRHVIASFAGVRAKISKGTYGDADFVVEESPRAPGLVNLVGIESPGLSAAPALAAHAAQLVFQRLEARPENPRFVSAVSHRKRFADLSEDEKREVIESDVHSRTIVCRCEQVTAREVLDAIESSVGTPTVAAVKAGCRSGAGRCQGGFCTPRIIDLMQHELGIHPLEITLDGPGSELLAGEAKALFA